jgi:hypothetical protein
MAGTVSVDADDLGMLVWCSTGYDRRLPYGIVPGHIWEALTQEWRDKISRWNAGDRDALGAEIQRRDQEA